MIHFINTLSHHFIICVVEKHWAIFKRKLREKVKVFEDIISLHEEFLENCFSSSLLKEQKFRDLVWNVCIFGIFYCENTNNFFYKHFNLDC